MNPGQVPRTIWTLWLQGRTNAPEVVQRCFESWERMNPDWRLVVLDETQLSDHGVDLDGIVGANEPFITPEAMSDIVRINLLADHGGVWVDATCLCMRPLDEWIHDQTPAGFFAFSGPRPGRLVASWFLASSRANALTTAWRDATNEYWRSNSFSGRASTVRRALSERLHRYNKATGRLTRLWFRRPVRWLLRDFSYFWFHYLFREVILADHGARDVWRGTPRISAGGPLRLGRHGLGSPPSAAVRVAVDERRDPLYKLKWRVQSDVEADTTVGYALRANATDLERDP